MRDAQSKLDQVIAFTGNTITGDDVATVLGLVGRDLLLDAVQAVADEDAPAAFALAGRAVEMGYDLRAVCRELSRVVRDLLVLSVDPSRIDDPEIAGEGERERLTALAARFSREDLLRAFDLLTRGGGGNPRRRAAAVSPRDGAAAVDLPAEAGADRGADRAWRAGWRDIRLEPDAATLESAPATGLGVNFAVRLEPASSGVGRAELVPRGVRLEPSSSRPSAPKPPLTA